jgi:hypothetical protein
MWPRYVLSILLGSLLDAMIQLVADFMCFDCAGNEKQGVHTMFEAVCLMERDPEHKIEKRFPGKKAELRVIAYEGLLLGWLLMRSEPIVRSAMIGGFLLYTLVLIQNGRLKKVKMVHGQRVKISPTFP